MTTDYKTLKAEEIGRRARAMLDAGKSPQALFYGIVEETRTPIAFISPDKTRGMLMVFSSAIMAHAFFSRLQAGRTPYQVVGFMLDDMEEDARAWQALGCTRFQFDPTPKTKTALCYGGDDTQITKESLTEAWAVSRASRCWLAEIWQAECSMSGKPGVSSVTAINNQRVLLEHLRDNGGFDVPFVHWVIALLAGQQGDEEGRLAATTELERFGPDFAGKTRPGMEPLEWGHSLADAYIGMMAEFGMLKGPDGVPLESILRVVNTPQPEAGSGPQAWVGRTVTE